MWFLFLEVRFIKARAPRDAKERAIMDGKFSVLIDSWYIFYLAIYKASGISSEFWAWAYSILPLNVLNTAPDDISIVLRSSELFYLYDIGARFYSIFKFV